LTGTVSRTFCSKIGH